MRRTALRGNRKFTTSNLFKPLMEKLEERQMFYTLPGVSFFEMPLGSGAELVCQMTASSEQLTVSRTSAGVQFDEQGNIDDVTGNFLYVSVLARSGSNSIVIEPNMNIGVCVWGGSGSDLISTGSSNDDLRATTGNDTLVSVGGVNNKLYAGAGYTNIWSTYGNYYYTGTGTLQTHFFQSFLNTGDITLDSPTLTEPGTDTTLSFNGAWQNYSANPLFSSAGPLFTDIHQGACGDCYFLSGLSATALTDPQQVRNIVTPLGDGTYAEQFSFNGQNYFLRVDANLPTDDDGSLFYAGLGAQGSTWVALMEKGWAYMESYERGLTPDYYSPDQGGNAWMALTALGSNDEFGPGVSWFTNAAQFGNFVNWELQNGNAMEIGFMSDVPGILVGDHEYTIVATTTYDGEVNGLWVRNPWGVDLDDSNGNPMMAEGGHNDGYDDGLVWVDIGTAFGDANDVGAATV